MVPVQPKASSALHSENAIPVHIFQRLFSDTVLKPATQRLTSYGGEFLKMKGTCHLTCKYKNTAAALEFYIVDTKPPPILWMRASVDLKLIKLILAVAEEEAIILQEYTDIFQGKGEFPGECNLHVDPHAKPVVYPPPRVPLARQDRLKQELDKMEESNVICKVTEPTEWVNRSCGNARSGYWAIKLTHIHPCSQHLRPLSADTGS